MADYTIRFATIEDKKAIHDLVVEVFLTDMPLMTACNVTELPSIDEWPSMQFLDNGLSVVAVSHDNRIIGVAINLEPISSGGHVASNGSIDDFMDVVNEESNGLVDRLKDTTMELRIMAVAGDSRGKGVAKRLIDETEKVAKSVGHTNIFGVASGAFMAAAFLRQNWVPSFVYFYKDYLKYSSDFKLPPHPHDCLTIFEKKLNNLKNI